MRKLLSTGDIAKVCQTTHASVIEWVDLGKLPQPIRTLGGAKKPGHRRWKATEVAPILLAQGYTIPDDWEQSEGPTAAVA